ncbi:MAG TPA: ABC transporter ATP-binding protein [Spirochaetota bacterium]|nr:ABC transporter ATP-binding protein [Spirochaetota bacterium]
MKEILKIMKFLRPYAGAMAVALLLLLFSSGILLVQPKLTQWAIDGGIRTGSVRVVLTASLAVLASAIASSALMYACGILLIRSSQKAGHDMRNRLFARVASFSFSNFDRWRTGELMVRLNSDVNRVLMFFRMGFHMLTQAVFILIGAVILMFLTNARLAVILTCMMAGLLLLFLLFSRVIRPIFLKMREALASLNNTLQESLAGAKLVRAFSRQDVEKQKFGKRNRDFYNLSIKAGIIIGCVMPFLMLIGNLAILLVLGLGGGGVAAGGMTLGQMTAFSNYAMMMVFPIVMLAMVISFMIMASASAERVSEVLQTEPGLKEKEGALHLKEFRGRMEFENVSFHYGDGNNALTGINLIIEPGERIGIIGTTGSGKSTLVNLIPRFYDVTAGVLRLDGHDTRDLSFDTVRGHIVVVLQETVLFSGTIAENIYFGRPDATMEEVQEAARAACAEEFILEKKKQYDEQVGERGMGLSGGQRQRIAIARSLLARPDILILDDVTSALDLQTENRVIQNLYTLPGKRTTIIISQKINSVKRADRILVLDQGQVRNVGTHDELLKSSPIYREIEETQNADAVEQGDE